MGTAYLEAVLLGILQGVAEFLPISSSGHLVVAGALLERVTGRDSTAEESLQLNVALHAGTLLSILWVYRVDVLRAARSVRTCLLLALATVPLVLIAVSPAKDLVEEAFDTPLVAGCGLLVTAALLWWTSRIPPEHERGAVGDVSWRQAGVVGLFQAMAILPGVSRSGSTISAGLFVGLERGAATTFSFLVAIPALCGATLLLVKDLATEPPDGLDVGPLVVGGAVACLVGVVSLRSLIRIVAGGRLHWFAVYCGLVGVATVVWQLVELASST